MESEPPPEQPDAEESPLEEQGAEESPPEQQDAEESPPFAVDTDQQFFFKTREGETRVINPQESWLRDALRSRRLLPSTSPEARLQTPMEDAEEERQVSSGAEQLTD